MEAPQILKQLVKKLLHLSGYQLRRVRGGPSRQDWGWNPWLTYAIPDSVLSMVKDHTMLSQVRLQALANGAWHVVKNSIGGDVVQCGVWRGGSAALLAHVIQVSGGPCRCLHLFDSFEGIPEPDEKVDGVRALEEAKRFGMGTQGRLIPNPQVYLNMGRPVGYIEDVRQLLEQTMGYDPRLVCYHKGMFEHVIPAEHEQIQSIAVLHLDGDLYSSTKVCLEYLYDKVVSGGIVIIDDYGAYDGCRKAVDEFFGQRGAHPYLHQVDREVVMFEKR